MERCNTGPAPTCTTARGNSIVDHVFSNLPEIASKLIRRPVPSADHVFHRLPQAISEIELLKGNIKLNSAYKVEEFPPAPMCESRKECVFSTHQSPRTTWHQF
jgi:hypothetical protein